MGNINYLEVVFLLYFFDTCALLNMGTDAFTNKFVISAQTLIELENIKSDKRKDESVRAKARRLSKLLDENEDKYSVIYTLDFKQDQNFQCRDVLPNSPDSVICYALWMYANYIEKDPDIEDKEVIFCTDDICCKNIAKNFISVPVCGSADIAHEEEYTGFKEVVLSDEEHSKLYSDPNTNTYSLLPNQYLIVKNQDVDVIDTFKWNGNAYVATEYKAIKTSMFGTTRAKDIYQKIALDSLATNKITMLCGPAGTGKSYLALSYLMKLVENHKIDKIIVFTNPCATNGAAKLGFYPGTRDEKLLDSQIGNMLGSKFGDKIELQRLIDSRKIQLLPFSDIRGFDTTGMNCAVYITEAQNLDVDMMKLALQRIGEDSICVVDGDYEAQVDMAVYAGDNNGMRRLSKVFRGSDFYGEVKLQNIYRSKIAELAQNM